jgi:ribose/xylose/arabinose/galactoside ABC-type transport system permease subunit
VIIFGTMNLVTFAHGEVYMVAAFVGYFAMAVYHLPWPVALVAGMAAGALAGYATEKVAFRPLRNAGHMPPLLITIGLSIILKDLVMIVWGAENRAVPSVYERTFEVAGIPISILQVVILLLAAALVVGLRLLLHGTKIGRAMRATAQDHEAAYAMGVRQRQPGLQRGVRAGLGARRRRRCPRRHVLQHRLRDHGRHGGAQGLRRLHPRRAHEHPGRHHRRARHRHRREPHRAVHRVRLA